jgi:hypothetical protein
LISLRLVLVSASRAFLPFFVVQPEQIALYS